MDAAEIVFYAFGTVFYLCLGLAALTALLTLNFLRNTLLRDSAGIEDLCAQLQTYLAQIAAYSSNPDAVTPFPFSKFPSGDDISK